MLKLSPNNGFKNLDYQWSKWNFFKPILATEPFSLNADFFVKCVASYDFASFDKVLLVRFQ